MKQVKAIDANRAASVLSTEQCSNCRLEFLKAEGEFPAPETALIVAQYGSIYYLYLSPANWHNSIHL